MEDILKDASAEELLEAVIVHLKISERNLSTREEALMRWGFALGREGGWEQCAPAWLKEYRKI